MAHTHVAVRVDKATETRLDRLAKAMTERAAQSFKGYKPTMTRSDAMRALMERSLDAMEAEYGLPPLEVIEEPKKPRGRPRTVKEARVSASRSD